MKDACVVGEAVGACVPRSLWMGQRIYAFDNWRVMQPAVSTLTAIEIKERSPETRLRDEGTGIVRRIRRKHAVSRMSKKK